MWQKNNAMSYSNQVVNKKMINMIIIFVYFGKKISYIRWFKQKNY